MSEHLELLRGAFPGRMVLGAKEIAIVLGRSTKAVERLRDRGIAVLPLSWGWAGRRRVVSIVDLAKWLDDGMQLPEDAPIKRAKTPPPKKPGARTRTGHTPKAPPAFPADLALSFDAPLRPSLLSAVLELNRAIARATEPAQELGTSLFWHVVISTMLSEILPDATAYELALGFKGEPAFAAFLAEAEQATSADFEKLTDWWVPGRDPVEEAIGFLRTERAMRSG